MLTQGCFPWVGTQPRFCPFYCCLVLPPFQDTYARKVSYRVLSSSHQMSCPFFQRALLLTALSISWGCYKSFLPVAVFSYFISVICSVPYPYKNYLSPAMIKKYLNVLKPRKKKRGQTKNTSLLLCERMTAREACLR